MAVAAVIALLAVRGFFGIGFATQKLLAGVIRYEKIFYIRSHFNVAEEHSDYK